MDSRKSLENEVQDAVDKTGFGKFHYKLFLVSSLVFMNTGFGVSGTGIIVTAARCSLEMSTLDIGRLTAAPMLGMVCGSYFWGCLADMKGRRVALLAALFLDSLAGMISSLVPHFSVFTALRFLNGFAITGQSAVIFPYLGEFQSECVRRTILAWLEMAFTIGIISLPLVGWLIVPLTFQYNWNYFTFASWNLFVFICALLPLAIGIALYFFPESPKYLVEDGQESKALRILASMYAENTGNPPGDYPVKYITGAEDPVDENKMAIVTSGAVLSPVRVKRQKKKLSAMLRNIVSHTVTILKPPYLSKTLLAAIIQFSMTSSYYTLMVWFPEIFQRFAEFETSFPDGKADICTVNSIMSANETAQDYDCGSPVSSSVYLFTIFLGLACIPTSIWLPMCIGRLGYKFFLEFSTIVSGSIAIGMLYVTSSFQNLILSCLYEAILSMGVSVIYCILVDFYPTNLRVIAAAFSAFCGRSGALIGNLMFGSLFDLDCVVPIGVVASLLFVAATLSLFLPGIDENTKNKSSSEGDRSIDKECQKSCSCTRCQSGCDNSAYQL